MHQPLCGHLAMRAGRELGTGFDVARKMGEASMIANMVSFSAAISACEKGEQGEKASTLRHKMRKTGRTAGVISDTTISACDLNGGHLSAREENVDGGL